MCCQSLSLVQYRAATSSKKLVCTRMQAARQEIMWQLQTPSSHMYESLLSSLSHYPQQDNGAYNYTVLIDTILAAIAGQSTCV